MTNVSRKRAVAPPQNGQRLPILPSPWKPPTVEPILLPETPTPGPSTAPKESTDGQLVVTLPKDERQDAKLEIDGKAYNIPPGGEPIKVPLPPGEHSLRIERPGYQAYTWKDKIEAEKEQAIKPTWIPTRITVAQLTAAYQQAVARLDSAEEKYSQALEPAEKLIVVWDFRGAAQALMKVQFGEADLAARLAARREEVQLLAALKARLIENIKSAEIRRERKKRSASAALAGR